MTSRSSNLIALALAGPLALGLYQLLLLVRGPDEVFGDEHPLPPAQADDFADLSRLSAWPNLTDWPMFGHDHHHGGRSPVDFPSANLEEAWLRPFEADTSHKWQRQPSATVWSPPAIATMTFADGVRRTMLYVGSYDRRLYALDAKAGHVVWHKTFSSGSVYSAPAVAMLGDRPVVIAASTDRVIYCLDARTGEQVWAHETKVWTQSTSPAAMSSPTPAVVRGRAMVFVGVWNSDSSGLENAQNGELLALDLATGAVVWKVRAGTSPVTTPAVAEVRGDVLVYAAAEDGSLRALDAGTGAPRWQLTLNQELRSSPSLILTEPGVPVLMIGTRYQSLYGIGAVGGAKLWRFMSGYWFDGTPAGVQSGDRTVAFAGSYDGAAYAVEAGGAKRINRPLWRFTALGQVRSSPAAVSVAGRPAVFFISWDNTLHLLSADEGKPLWSKTGGKLLFEFEFQGDSLWSSPAAAEVDGRPTVFFPSHDGKLYAFHSAR